MSAFVRDHSVRGCAHGTVAAQGPLEREAALNTLTGAVRDAAAGRGCAVLVTGEAGVGKTTVARAFVEAVRNRARVLRGACDDLLTPRALGYDADARPAQAFPPTGRRFATTQTHWFRIADGKIIEHWANLDDLGTAMQLGWSPPSPPYLVRMLLATLRALW